MRLLIICSMICALPNYSYAGVIVYTSETAFNTDVATRGLSGRVDDFAELTPNINVSLSTLNRPDFVVRSVARGTNHASTFEVIGSGVGPNVRGINSNFGADDLIFDFKAPINAVSVLIDGFGTLGGIQTMSFSLDGGPIKLGLVEGSSYVPNAFLGIVSDSGTFSSLLIRNSPGDQITVNDVASYRTASAVPEPSTLQMLLGFGCSLLAYRFRNIRAILS
jgi:hypothetical protein